MAQRAPAPDRPSVRPAGPGRATRLVGAGALALALSACHPLALREHHAGDAPLSLDGLRLAPGPGDTTREVIAMLDLGLACRSPSPDCARAILVTPGSVREATRLVAAAEIEHQAARQPRWTDDALAACIAHTHRYLVEPDLDGRATALGARSQHALLLHNACTARLLERSGGGPDRLHWDVDTSAFPIEGIERVVAAEALRPRGLRTRQRDDGLGVAAVAIGRSDGRRPTFPAQPFALPITVRAEPLPGGGPPRLVASDASGDAMHATAFGALPLARDRSAAYAAAALAFEAELSWWEALRLPPGETRGPEVRLLAPVDPRRTPVLLVHGLASSPMTWANMVNELQGDPRIAQHYQFWLLRYPTGQPLLYNRQALARTITEFHDAALPRSGSDAPAMVAIGHSMGGVLARLLVTDSGTALWDAAFAVSPDALQGTAEDRRAARALFEFEALPGIDEVILIAAPHRGSARADGLLARLVRRVIAGPGRALDFLGRLAAANPSAVPASLGASYLAGGPASLDTLAPSQPVSVAASRLPVVDGVRVHSIIGVRDPRHPERGDGVVALESATWPQGSHHRVPGDHAVHAVPATVLLVKRLLLERLEHLAQDAEAPPAPRERD